MKQEFIPYEEALALKELGFDEPTSFYWENNVIKPLPMKDEVGAFHFNRHSRKEKEWICAPTFSQAFRWFREKYKLQTYIDFYHSESYFFKIKSQDGKYIGNTGDIILQGSPVFTRTYEEAELACLVKLIEIVKTNKL